MIKNIPIFEPENFGEVVRVYENIRDFKKTFNGHRKKITI